ncbi:uncharacterized protein KGF55_002567 [Candida pseudojiufengensis]|uniref:uncharacterized protein n=1 Tax=Candida pseudojiufengensis TaxID=497109 RepID=UPI0022241A61|nr:uncharacterized protein KGF55_002567 [Candida pseudojiufengensis]KAI5963687.1 hypothetical protein KGF55_002567 [Candida pseudojiufengensis]
MSIEYIESENVQRTRVYHKNPLTNNSENDFLILIPGNPGLINYYITYLNYIQEKVPKFEILCIEYLGFLAQNVKKDSKGNQIIYSVDDQINHKFEIIKKIINDRYSISSNKSNIFLLSHSLGGFITERVILKLLQDDSLSNKFNIKFNGMITPTVNNIAQSESGTALTKLINWNVPFVGIAMSLSLILNYIPTSVLKYILTNNWKPPKEIISKNHHNIGLEHSLEATIQFISSPSSLNQCLNMAKDEMKVINDSDLVNDEIFNNKNFFTWCFFAQNDHWVTHNTRNHLISKYSTSVNTKLEICENLNYPIKHAFVLNQSKEFADITVDRMKPFVE